MLKACKKEQVKKLRKDIHNIRKEIVDLNNEVKSIYHARKLGDPNNVSELFLFLKGLLSECFTKQGKKNLWLKLLILLLERIVIIQQEVIAQINQGLGNQNVKAN